MGFPTFQRVWFQTSSPNERKPTDLVLEGQKGPRHTPFHYATATCLSSWQLYNITLTFRLFTPAALSGALVLDTWSLFVNKKHIQVIRITPKANNHVLIRETMLPI